jgi:hypothetical protein
MSAFMHDVARASLPVAIALLVFAATARGALWAQIDDAAAQRVAREYLGPLATWCLIAVATHVLALGAAGDVTFLSLAFALVLGAAAMLLRTVSEPEEAPARPAAAAPAPAPAPTPPPARRLWAEPANGAARKDRLWSR